MNGFTQIALHCHRDIWFVTLSRPETRNALAPEMVAELTRVLELAEADAGVRALVLRGSQGFFCAGGNIGNFKSRLDGVAEGSDPVAARNREFGYFMQRLATVPVPVIAVVEGAAMGGGMGLACAADIVLAAEGAKFALSETSLGIIPAQIAPFVMARIGAVGLRRLGLTGDRVQGDAALQLGIVDALAPDADALDALLADWLSRICRCAPGANRALKTLVREGVQIPEGHMLDVAAQMFSHCMRHEGAEGIAAFREKRAPAWAATISAADVRQLDKAPSPT